MEERKLSEKESLDLIAEMITKAKESYHDTGIGAIMWGSIIAFCSLERLAEIQFNYTLPFDIYLLTLLAIVPQIFISIREKKEKKVKSYDDIFLGYLWLGFGISIFLLIHVSNTIFSAWEPVREEYATLAGRQASFQFQEYVAPLFLILYGMPTFVTGIAFKFKPMMWGGLLCWICSVIAAYTNIKIDHLLTAISAIMAWLIPGIIMEKGYRMAKKAEMARDV